jgi:hypothetical protein
MTLVLRYLARVKKPFIAALVVSLCIAMLPVNLVFVSFIQIVFTSLVLARFLINLNDTPSELFLLITSIFTVVFISLPLTLVFAPDVFLFINALPFMFSFPLLTSLIFIASFESFLIRDPELRDNFSLLNIALRPRQRIAFLRLVLAENRLSTTRPGILNEERAQQELELTEAEFNALESRQRALIARLPPDAIIDSLTLYQNSLEELGIEDAKTLPTRAREGAEKEAREKGKEYSETLYQKHFSTLKIQDSASAQSRAIEKIIRESKYCATLDTEAKKIFYQEYCRLTLTLAPFITTCPVSLNTPSESNEKFILVEKFFKTTDKYKQDKYYAVPKFQTVYNHISFLDAISTNNRGMALSPVERDPYFDPRPYPNDKYSHEEHYNPENGSSCSTKYVYFKYTTVENHPLSHHLCEAIEHFLDPKLGENYLKTLKKLKNPLPPSAHLPTLRTQTNHSSVPNYRNAPPDPNTTVTRQNIFTVRNMNGIDIEMDIELYNEMRTAGVTHLEIRASI